MIKTSYFEDYEIGSSRETFGRTITEADIVLHAGQTGDFFPHHMDAEWVKTQEFKERIAHGTLILSIGIGMTANEIKSGGLLIWLRPHTLHPPGLYRRYYHGQSHYQRKARLS